MKLRLSMQSQTAVSFDNSPHVRSERLNHTPYVFAVVVLSLLFAQLAASAPSKLHLRTQAGVITNDSGSDNVFPTGFLNLDEGFNLNRSDLIWEKPLETNLQPRIGPFPGPTPDAFDWGFEVMLRYGQDAALTFGLDDELEINEGEDNLWLLPQWHLTAHLPVWEGVSVMAGSFFTPVGYEIGAPVDPPTGFYTHSYAFAYQPVKHVGVLASARLPAPKASGMWALELGVVQGWNNLQDNNGDKTLIAGLRWRSEDFRTWVDFENIVGNEQSEDGITDQTRPFNAVSSSGEKLLRNFHSLTVTQRLDERRRWALNAIYGHQEGGDVAADKNNPPGFLITEDSAWYGANFNYYDRFAPNLQYAVRAEWLRDDKGAHALLPAGDYHGITANLSWWALPTVRIRPEVRYDWYEGDGLPFGGRRPAVFFGEEDRQWVVAIDLTWFLDIASR
jgi:hypothetical protein